MSSHKKGKANKRVHEKVWSDETWKVYVGELRRRPGRPTKVAPLFLAIAEKLPFSCLGKIEADLRNNENISPNGVYVAHDSMGYARYVGRGHIFSRLKARKREQILELVYFSFYIVADKRHEREIETLLIRAGGPHLHFNSRKKRVDIQPGNVRDFEDGTIFYERRYPRRSRKKPPAREPVAG